MIKNIFPLVILMTLSSHFIFSQAIDVYEKFELPKKVKETSGLIYFDGHLVTHNDSGDDPYLYEIDTLNGDVIRKVEIINATHIDWEDITQDETFIYVGDIGNNYGDRTDLKIYRITKYQFLNQEEVIASVISFNYNDQFIFNSNHHATNFDAEALTVMGDSLLLLTKNWLNYQTNVYYLSKSPGNQVAKKIGSYNTNGLITGATYNEESDSYYLCGYNGNLKPFLVSLSDFASNDIFSGDVVFTDISPFLGMSSQTEGIAFVGGNQYFLSREKVKIEIGDDKIVFPQKLYSFRSEKITSDVTDFNIKDLNVIYPNPGSEYIFLDIGQEHSTIQSIDIYNVEGKHIGNKSIDNQSQIYIGDLKSSIYLMRIRLEDNRVIVCKFVKK